MKKLVLWTLLFLYVSPPRLLACPTCEKQQPELLKGISHGAGPQSDWDMIIVWGTAVVVILTLFFSVKWLLRPGEKGKSHIKHSILSPDESL